MQYLIGVDGGGTGCRVIISDSEGNQLGAAQGGPANIMTGFEAAQKNILSACKAACDDAGVPHAALENTSAFMGLAGANSGESASKTKQNMPFENCIIETDAVTSLEGAIGAADGAVAIIGTGSVFIYRIEGKIRTVGGWGYMIGDLGSGARLGRELLEKTLLAYDGIHDPTDLTSKVMGKFNNDPNIVVDYAHTAAPGEFATFAPLIFDYAQKRDPVAQKILRKAVNDIEETLDAILVDDNQRFCMLGGLGVLYADLVNSNLRKRIHPPKGNAVSGAIALAVRHFCGSEAQ